MQIQSGRLLTAPLPPRPLTRFDLYSVGKDIAEQISGTTYTDCHASQDYASTAADNASASNFVHVFTKVVPTSVLSTFIPSVKSEVICTTASITASRRGISGATVSDLLERYKARFSSTVNAGDVELGIFPSQWAADIRSGTVSISRALGKIPGLRK